MTVTTPPPEAGPLPITDQQQNSGTVLTPHTGDHAFVRWESTARMSPAPPANPPPTSGCEPPPSLAALCQELDARLPPAGAGWVA